MSRQVIRVHYCVDDLFLIPENIDLNNKNQVKDYGIKWNILYIYFVDGSEIEIKSQGWIDDFDYKRPNDDYYPEPAEDFRYVDNDDEGFKPVDVYQPTTEVAKVVEPEPVPEPEPDRVIITKVDGKKYLKSRNTGNVYDYDIYAKESKQVIVGKWNEEKQQIKFNNITDLEKVNREKIVDIAKEYSVNNGRWQYVDILTDIKNLCKEHNVILDKDLLFTCLECFSSNIYENDDDDIVFMDDTIYYYDEKTCEWAEKNVDDDVLETKCGCKIIINSRDHDECRCDIFGENWICADCYNGEYDDEDDEEEIEELEKKYDEAIKNIKLPTAEEIKNMKPALDAAQLEKLFGTK